MFDLLPCGFAGFLEFVGFFVSIGFAGFVEFVGFFVSIEFVGFVEFTYNFSSLRALSTLGTLPSYIPRCILPNGMAI